MDKMGTYYSLGIVHRFHAKSNRAMSNQEWMEAIDERLDTRLFDMTPTELESKGNLQPGIFEENIAGFYETLRGILGPDRNPELDYYEQSFGNELEKYQWAVERMRYRSSNGASIQLNLEFALLFIEGKVLIEVFYTEPKLINWLFRHSPIENKLKGCVISSIVG